VLWRCSATLARNDSTSMTGKRATVCGAAVEETRCSRNFGGDWEASAATGSKLSLAVSAASAIVISMNSSSIRNKVVIVTGGSRGIGATTSLLAAQLGCAVCVNYLCNHKAARTITDTISNMGGRAIPVQADVSVETDVERLFRTCDELLGKPTALVNNAGILETQMRVETMRASRLERIFRTNVIGPFLCSREAVRRMSTKNGGTGGAIVNVSSGASRLGSPNEYVDYAASKGAIDTLTIGLSKEVAAEGIRVCAVL
jgi:NAD(P)-dependent dehydrogenase (short-subunit alcohol dehydrogenase family)